MGRFAPWLLVLSACNAPTALAIDRVQPSSGTNVDVVPVRIVGTNFHLPIRSDLDDGTNVVGDMVVTIGEPLIGAIRIDDTAIEGSVPAGLQVGDYDVVVQLGDSTDVLVAGYRVTDARVQPPAGPCQHPGVLADDFADGTTASTWAIDDGANVTEVAGELLVRPGGPGGTGYHSDPYVDLTGGAAEVEVRAAGSTGTGAVTYFLMSQAGQELGFREVDGMLTMGIAPDTISIPFDADAHRDWRIAEAAGTVTFETSPDGTSWTTRHSAATPPWATFVQLSLGASNPKAAANPGTAVFAQMSTFVAPATWCPTTTLSDPFDDTIGPEWLYHAHTSNGCTETESGGAAHTDQRGSMACDAYFASSSLYSLASSEIVVRITAITTFTAGWITYFAAEDLDGNRVRLYFDQNQMCVDGTGLTVQCEAYNTNEDLWRIRESGGTLFFEVADSLGAGFRLLRSVPVTFPVTAIRPRFGTATDRAIGTTIGLSTDRFN